MLILICFPLTLYQNVIVFLHSFIKFNRMDVVMYTYRDIQRVLLFFGREGYSVEPQISCSSLIYLKVKLWSDDRRTVTKLITNKSSVVLTLTQQLYLNQSKSYHNDSLINFAFVSTILRLDAQCLSNLDQNLIAIGLKISKNRTHRKLSQKMSDIGILFRGEIFGGFFSETLNFENY